MTIDQIKYLKEEEHKVEFKEAATQYRYNSGRRCVLGYIIALGNEGGGYLILGVKENKSLPHQITGSAAWDGSEGKLEQDVYRDLKIRISTEILYEDSKRVLVIHIPSRPVGRALKFQDVPLMRVGEDLLSMSDEQYFAILQEQEPDFSATICSGANIIDLDPSAIQKLKAVYAEKQNNPLFLTVTDQQALSDLGLIQNLQLTYAAITLLGKPETIRKYLPQSSINVEYRNTTQQIIFDKREIFCEAYFTAIDKIWDLIDLRNGKVPVQQGAYIFDIPYFNKEVIREALNNAVAHRDYHKSSEVVIKQFSNELHIINPGGFPLGVSLDNLLTVNSTPRNRLLADVMAKTGVVERSGQGVDKIFFQTISEAKPEPDYSYTDNSQVELRLYGIVEDKAFALFIKKIQLSRKNEEKLSVEEVIALNRIRKGVAVQLSNQALIKKLEAAGLVERFGKTTAQKLILSKEYYSFTGKEAQYSMETPLAGYQISMIISEHLEQFKRAKMSQFVLLLHKFLTREQVKYQIQQMVSTQMLEKHGKGSGTYYTKGKRMEELAKVAQRAVELGIQQMVKLGELSS